MMVTTHVAAGLLLAVSVATLTPNFAIPAAIGAIIGGILPDIDLFIGSHRRTLHFPVYYTAAGGVTGLITITTPSVLTVGVSIGLLAAGIHSLSDWLGAGEELRPWERTSQRAVYIHSRRQWLQPQYIIRYDGAPEDFALTIVLAAPAVITFDGWLRGIVLAGIVIAGGYTITRKYIPRWLDL
ncbi:membrane protein [Haloquadratum walsbyi]|nr:membrane protein [Haloquadratum walsbyi]